MNELFSALYTLIINEGIDDARVGRKNSSISIKNFRNTRNIEEQIRDNRYTYLLIKLKYATIKIDLSELNDDVQVIGDEMRLYTDYQFNNEKRYISIKLNCQTS
jgi:hypothetical protein